MARAHWTSAVSLVEGVTSSMKLVLAVHGNMSVFFFCLAISLSHKSLALAQTRLDLI